MSVEEKSMVVSGESYVNDDLEVLLKQYYKRLFPTRLYHKWLQYGVGKSCDNGPFHMYSGGVGCWLVNLGILDNEFQWHRATAMFLPKITISNSCDHTHQMAEKFFSFYVKSE